MYFWNVLHKLFDAINNSKEMASLNMKVNL